MMKAARSSETSVYITDYAASRLGIRLPSSNIYQEVIPLGFTSISTFYSRNDVNSTGVLELPSSNLGWLLVIQLIFFVLVFKETLQSALKLATSKTLLTHHLQSSRYSLRCNIKYAANSVVT